jgi:hypothetical protein
MISELRCMKHSIDIPFRGDVFELVSVLWIDLSAQRCGEHELANVARESVSQPQRKSTGSWEIKDLPSKKCIERKVCDKYTVRELKDTREDQEREKRVDKLQSSRCAISIGSPQG